MWLRDLILKDWWLKISSLALAVLIWVTVSFMIHREGGEDLNPLINSPARVFYVPVLVMSSAADVREVQVRPEHVEITVRGQKESLARLQEKDIHAIVNLTDIESARGVRKRIEVTTPPGVVYTRIFPEDVEVVLPPKSDATGPALSQ
jgi:YbbR domain-containing protein